MPVFRIPKAHVFPDPELADDSGLLGVGGDLHVDRLLLAYRSGIFAWYSEGQPILWWSPDPRMVMRPADLHVPRSLAKVVRRGDYRVTLDQAFGEVIRGCAETERPGQPGTWITPEMEAAYNELFRRGWAHSIEAWRGDELVGGLYAVAIGGLFFGESMFARAPDASKVAYVHIVRQLARWGFTLIDAQVYTSHLSRFGATEIARHDYLARMREAILLPDRKGPWTFDPDFSCRG